MSNYLSPFCSEEKTPSSRKDGAPSGILRDRKGDERWATRRPYRANTLRGRHSCSWRFHVSVALRRGIGSCFQSNLAAGWAVVGLIVFVCTRSLTPSTVQRSHPTLAGVRSSKSFGSASGFKYLCSLLLRLFKVTPTTMIAGNENVGFPRTPGSSSIVRE
jgi:hypothetical protein